MSAETSVCTDRNSGLTQSKLDEPVLHSTSASLLSSLLQGSAEKSKPQAIHGVVIGELLALTDDGQTPLVGFPGQAGTAAVRARSSMDLGTSHIGREVVLMFSNGDPTLPIVMGVLQGTGSVLQSRSSSTVAIDADGERVVVAASDQLVLRCGRARITLTKAGKVLIEGSYVLSRSSGVNRIKGGSVQLN